MKYKFVGSEHKIEQLQQRQANLEAQHNDLQVQIALLEMIPEDERPDNFEALIKQRRDQQVALDEGWEQVQKLIEKVKREDSLEKKAKKNGKSDPDSAEAEIASINGNRPARRAAAKK